MIHLFDVDVKHEPPPELRNRHPFTVPIVQTFRRMRFSTPITFFVGENGSGKSTVLEAVAAGAGLPTVGTDAIERDETLESARLLSESWRFGWALPRTKKGFFLRAEDFFGFVRYLTRLRAEMVQGLELVDQEYGDRSALARNLAETPMRASLANLERRYGKDFDAQSHGERFLALCHSRFVPGGLYLIDEPEAALSPQSQLAFVALLLEMIRNESQFIIATHAPIILATPGATLYDFDTVPVQTTDYASLAHVTLTRDFLNAPERFLRHLGTE